MVRLGKIADQVLKDITEKGYSDRRAVWIRRGSSFDSRPGVKGTARVDTFPKIRVFTRKDIPGYGPIKVVCRPKPASSDSSKDKDIPDMNIIVRIPTFKGDALENGVWTMSHVPIGVLKIIRSGIGSLYPVYPEFRTGWKTHRMRIIGAGFQDHELNRLIQIFGEHIFGHGIETDPHLAELNRQFCLWMKEDKYCLELARKLTEISNNKKMVKSIITT